jgi:hypothetical protein
VQGRLNQDLQTLIRARRVLAHVLKIKNLITPQVGFGSEDGIDSIGSYWFYCNASNVFGQKCLLCTTDLSHVTDFRGGLRGGLSSGGIEEGNCLASGGRGDHEVGSPALIPAFLTMPIPHCQTAAVRPRACAVPGIAWSSLADSSAAFASSRCAAAVRLRQICSRARRRSENTKTWDCLTWLPHVLAARHYRRRVRPPA